MAKNCKDCVYYRYLSVGNEGKACHYLLDTGKVRGCPAENCTKKRPLKKERSKK